MAAAAGLAGDSSMRATSAAPGFLFLAIAGAGLALAYGGFVASGSWLSVWIAVGAFVLATIVGAAVKVAAQWDRAVVLRLGRFFSLRGPGLLDRKSTRLNSSHR